MIARPLWFLAGAGVGVYSVIRARQLAETFTVDGLRDRAEALTLGARLFAQEVSVGQHEKEAELRERLGLAPSPHAALAAGSPAEPPRPMIVPPPRTTDPQENDH